MPTYTARCIVVRCDVKDCPALAEILCRDGASNPIDGWLEVYPHGGGQDATARRKFICPDHASLLNLGSFDGPAEIPLSQAIQNPRFQRPDTLAFIASLDLRDLPAEVLEQGNKVLAEVAKQKQTPALTEKK